MEMKTGMTREDGNKQKKMGGKEKEYEKYRELLSAIIRINASKYIDIYTYKKHINFDLLIS